MKKNILIFISFSLAFFCCFCFQNNKKHLQEKVDEKIFSIEFKQNPAMDYYFTRKYKLTSEKLFYYNKSVRLIEMGKDDFLYAKKIIDSLPKNALKSKFLGHTTVDIDVPDWTIEIIKENNDTIFLASGDLPKYMENYNNIVWKTVNRLDNHK